MQSITHHLTFKTTPNTYNGGFFKKYYPRLTRIYLLERSAFGTLGCNLNYAKLVGLRSCEEIIGKTDHELNWQPTGHSAEEFINRGIRIP